MESLRGRNERLAKEVSRLHSENKSLKVLCRKLLSKELNIPQKKFKDKAMQTVTEDIPIILKSLVKRRSSSTPPVPQDRSSLDSWTRNPFRFSPPQSGNKSLEKYNGRLGKPGSSARKSHVITPPSTDRLASESKMKMTPISPTSPMLNRLSPGGKDEDLLFLHTPVRSLFHEDYADDEDELVGILKTAEKRAAVARTPKSKTHVGTPMPPSSRTKLPRSVSRITSYKEPSLTVKVRKGFKFFAFDESV